MRLGSLVPISPLRLEFRCQSFQQAASVCESVARRRREHTANGSLHGRSCVGIQALAARREPQDGAPAILRVPVPSNEACSFEPPQYAGERARMYVQHPGQFAGRKSSEVADDSQRESLGPRNPYRHAHAFGSGVERVCDGPQQLHEAQHFSEWGQAGCGNISLDWLFCDQAGEFSTETDLARKPPVACGTAAGAPRTAGTAR